MESTVKKEIPGTTLPYPTPARRRIYSVIALAIPVLFFVILELSLRAGHYGPDLAIFTRERVAGKAMYTFNPACKARYFNRTDFTPDPSPEYFTIEKPAGTFRIFCLGGSTTVGYPYWYNGAFASFLRNRLQLLCPGRPVEVVNLGMTATNSYTVLDIGRELLRYQPDLIIVYDGHNEFYGALGVASQVRLAPTRGLNLLYLRLVHFRTFQLVREIVFKARNVFGKPLEKAADRATLMEQVAGGKNVPHASSLYRQAGVIFQKNMQALARLYRNHDIPVIFSTQSSNLRDLAPFVSNHSPGLNPRDIERFQAQYRRALEQEAAGRIDSALVSFNAAIGIDPGYAEAHYRLARCLEASGRLEQAGREYILARDYDELRFRCDSEFNNLIRAMAGEKGCLVADIEGLFKSVSPDSLTGLNLFSEHLHPTAYGQFLIAGEYARIMQQNSLLAPAQAWKLPSAAIDSLLWQNRPLTPVDELIAARKIEFLTTRWPFQHQPQAVPAIASGDTLRLLADRAVHNQLGWITVHERAADYYLQRGERSRAAREFETIINQLPHHVAAYLKLAKIHYDDRDFSRTETLLLASLQVEPTPLANRVLGDIYLRERKVTEAIRCYEALARFPRDPVTAADNAYMLALAYLAAEKPGAAVDILERTITLFPAYQPARALLAQIRPAGRSSSGR